MKVELECMREELAATHEVLRTTRDNAGNSTQDFMDAMFDDHCHSYIREKARELDSSGHEVHRRREQAEPDIAEAQKHAAEVAAREERANARVARLRAIDLVEDDMQLERLTRKQIDAQLTARRLDDPDIPSVSSMKKGHVSRANALVELRKAIARAHERRAAASRSLTTDDCQNEATGHGAYLPIDLSPEAYGSNDEGSDIDLDL